MQFGFDLHWLVVYWLFDCVCCHRIWVLFAWVVLWLLVNASRNYVVFVFLLYHTLGLCLCIMVGFSCLAWAYGSDLIWYLFYRFCFVCCFVLDCSVVLGLAIYFVDCVDLWLGGCRVLPGLWFEFCVCMLCSLFCLCVRFRFDCLCFDFDSLCFVVVLYLWGVFDFITLDSFVNGWGGYDLGYMGVCLICVIWCRLGWVEFNGFTWCFGAAGLIYFRWLSLACFLTSDWLDIGFDGGLICGFDRLFAGLWYFEVCWCRILSGLWFECLRLHV